MNTSYTDIYVALRDSDQPQSFVIGAFSIEAKAQEACEAEATGNAEAWGNTHTWLTWENAEATAGSGDHYAVVLVTLDVPVA